MVSVYQSKRSVLLNALTSSPYTSHYVPSNQITYGGITRWLKWVYGFMEHSAFKCKMLWFNKNHNTVRVFFIWCSSVYTVRMAAKIKQVRNRLLRRGKRCMKPLFFRLSATWWALISHMLMHDLVFSVVLFGWFVFFPWYSYASFCVVQTARISYLCLSVYLFFK